jgi:4-hydroxymandelate oxidase
MRLSLADFERDAAEVLEPMTREYYRGGSDDEVTLSANRAAWGEYALRYRVLAGVGERSTRTAVLGVPLEAPILVAPTAFQKMAHPEGEVAMARGAGRRGSLMVVSTLANTPVEEIAAAASGPLWFQLYVYRDREVTRSLVERAEAAGCRALVLTVDTPVLGNREGEARVGFRMAPGLGAGNLAESGHDALPGAEGASGLARYAHRLLDADLTWSDVTWLRSITSLPVVVKGLVHPDDARLAAEAGADAVIVSNHGGRQLDGSIATAHALPAVCEALAGTAVEVLVDGGIRRGTDIVRALALGARAVLVGRPALWGLALGGADGVAEVLGLLHSELDRALALCGIPTVDDLRGQAASLLG